MSLCVYDADVCFLYVVDFRITSLVEDFRPEFVGHSVITLNWNQFYNRMFHASTE